jgi:hypothetical protein
MAWIDRILSIFLILAGIVHGFHALHYFTDNLAIFWSVCGALFVILIGIISLLRASRPGDRGLAWTCVVSELVWIWMALWFGRITGRVVDVHVLAVVVVTLGMCAFSVRSLVMVKR